MHNILTVLAYFYVPHFYGIYPNNCFVLKIPETQNMKRNLLIVVLFASLISHAQTVSIDSLLQLPVKKIRQWKVARANDSTAILPLVYAADDWVKQPAVQKLKDASITKV